MNLSNVDKKHLRRIGHRLNPIVTVSSRGLSDNVGAEIERALNDHELIKIKLSVDDRAVKTQLIEDICKNHRAVPIQTIGHVLLLYRPADKPDPRLSNLLR